MDQSTALTSLYFSGLTAADKWVEVGMMMWHWSATWSNSLANCWTQGIISTQWGGSLADRQAFSLGVCCQLLMPLVLAAQLVFLMVGFPLGVRWGEPPLALQCDGYHQLCLGGPECLWKEEEEWIFRFRDCVTSQWHFYEEVSNPDRTTVIWLVL